MYYNPLQSVVSLEQHTFIPSAHCYVNCLLRQRMQLIAAFCIGYLSSLKNEVYILIILIFLAFLEYCFVK